MFVHNDLVRLDSALVGRGLGEGHLGFLEAVEADLDILSRVGGAVVVSELDGVGRGDSEQGCEGLVHSLIGGKF